MFQPARRVAFAAFTAAAMMLAPMINSLALAQVPYSQMQAPSRPNPADVAKYAAVVVDANTGEVLYAKRADSPRYPASITKVMTLYLLFEELAAGRMDLDDRIPFSTRAARLRTRGRRLPRRYCGALSRNSSYSVFARSCWTTAFCTCSRARMSRLVRDGKRMTLITAPSIRRCSGQ